MATPKSFGNQGHLASHIGSVRTENTEKLPKCMELLTSHSLTYEAAGIDTVPNSCVMEKPSQTAQLKTIIQA